MEFRLPYMEAMRAQAPTMFKELSRSNQLEQFVALKAREASNLFKELTKDAPKLPSGYPEQPFAREAEEAVLSQLIQFPSTESEQRDQVRALLGPAPITQPTPA
jgi:hypothetical protein